MASTIIEDCSFAPPHVPRELIWDHDLNAFARTLDDPFQIGSRLRQGPQLIYARGATRGQPGWVPTRFALLQEIFMDAARFSSDGNVGVGDLLGVDWQLNPIDIDAPAHMPYRMVIQPSFSATAMRDFEPTVRSIARELIAQFDGRGGCEFMEDFANQFPSRVFLKMSGLPNDMLPQFLEWEHGFVRGSDLDERRTSLRAINDYLEFYVEQRRSDERDDVISAILNARIAGRPLDHGEIMGMCMVLYLGGLDTVLSSLSWHMNHLAKDKALQQRLRANPDQIAGATDDLLRCYGVTTTRRYVREDLEFHGVQMKKGDRILMPTYLASRDPDQYPDPDIVDPDRRPRHLTFATGVHNCLGAHLARLEVRVVLEEFLSRFDDIRIAEGEAPEWQTDGVWAMTRLPLILDRANATPDSMPD